MKKPLLFICVLFLIGCFGNEEPFVDPDLISPSPISEIQEKFYASPEVAYSKVVSALESEGFSVNSSDYINGFETGSVSVQDKVCNSTYSAETPLPCRVRFFVRVLPEEGASRVFIKYHETCMDQEHIRVSCKDSKGEDFLFRIHRKISSN